MTIRQIPNAFGVEMVEEPNEGISAVVSGLRLTNFSKIEGVSQKSRCTKFKKKNSKYLQKWTVLTRKSMQRKGYLNT